MICPKSSALVLIDLQAGFYDSLWGARNNFLLERKVASVLKAARLADIPVIHVRHDSREAASPLRAGAQGFSFLPEAMPAPSEAIFTKSMHGAFVGTKLESHLRWLGCHEPIFAGLTTDHCISTSVRMAADLGFSPRVISDATATFPRLGPSGHWIAANEIQEAALASLHQEFAELINTDYFVHHSRKIS